MAEHDYEVIATVKLHRCKKTGCYAAVVVTPDNARSCTEGIAGFSTVGGVMQRAGDIVIEELGRRVTVDELVPVTIDE